MKLSHEKIIPFILYVIAGIVLCGVFRLHRNADFSQTFEAECSDYNNVTDVSEMFSLQAGTYILDLLVNAEGTVPEAFLQVYSKAYGEILTEPIHNMEESFSYRFQLERPFGDVSIRVVYAGYDGSETERVDVTAVTIRSDRPMCTDTPFAMAVFLLIYLAAGLYGFRERRAAKEEVYALLIGMAVIFSSFPLMKGYLTGGHDLAFHLSRVEGIKEALLCGQFPVRVHPPYNAGHGYATAALYPELFLYIPALLRVMGVSITTSVIFFLFLVNLATALIMYFAVKSVTKSSYHATLASVIYTLSLYRFSCMHLRAAWGELLALCFLPLVVSGIYHVFIGNQKKWIQLVIGATGVLQSHIISTLLTAFLAVFLGLLYFRRLLTDRRWISLLKSVAMIVLCNLWFLIPFMDFYQLDLNLKYADNIFHEHAVIPAQLFCLFGDHIGVSNPLEMGIRWEMSITPGITVGVCMLACLVLLRRLGKRGEGFSGALFWFGTGCVICSTSLIPWEYLEIISFVDLLTSTVQFPWRLLGEATVLAVMSAVMAGAEMYPGPEKKKEKKWVLAVMTCLGILGCVPLGSRLLEDEGIYTSGVRSVSMDLGYYKEYLLRGTDDGLLAANRYVTSDDRIQVLEYQKDGTTVSVRYSGAGNGGWIEIPLLWYPGYQATDLASGDELPVLDGENHVIRVAVPCAEEGQFMVSYTGRTRYHVAGIISVLTILGSAGIWGFGRRNILPVPFRRRPG